MSAGPYRHVVTGTDGSATAARAVTHAAGLAAACGAALTIVSAYRRDERAAGPSGGSDSWMVTDAAGATDHVLAGQGLARAAGVEDVRARTEAGDPAGVLLDIAEEVGADLIVVGSRGMAAASRFLLGSVPNRVSHHATCDVVIVRTGD